MLPMHLRERLTLAHCQQIEAEASPERCQHRFRTRNRSNLPAGASQAWQHLPAEIKIVVQLPELRIWIGGHEVPGLPCRHNSPGAHTRKCDQDRWRSSAPAAAGAHRSSGSDDRVWAQAPAPARAGTGRDSRDLRINTCLLSSTSTTALSPSPMRPERNSSARESSSRRITARRSGRAP